VRRIYLDVAAVIVAVVVAFVAVAVHRAASLTLSRTYHMPWGQYLLASLLRAAVAVVLALPVWWALRRRGGARFQWGLFLLYAIPGLLALIATPLYMRGIGHPYLTPITERLATGSGDILGGAMIGIGLIRGALPQEGAGSDRT
jgi:hypothetical protein